jgi:hypothetical protein
MAGRGGTRCFIGHVICYGGQCCVFPETDRTQWFLVRKRTIETEQPPLEDDVNVKFCWQRLPRGQRNGSQRSLNVNFLDRRRYFLNSRFVTAFTRDLHLSLSWDRPVQSTPSHSISTRSILMLSTNLRLDLRSGLFSSGFLNQ